MKDVYSKIKYISKSITRQRHPQINYWVSQKIRLKKKLKREKKHSLFADCMIIHISTPGKFTDKL